MERRDDIDGLRALAVLPIVLFHLGVLGLGGGYVGVDIFFVISGFLITQRLDADGGLLRFYERRARRILPALFVVLAATTAVALAILMPLDLAAYGRSLVATISFFSNMQFWSEVSYFDERANLKPLLHTWSLAVEEQFYVLFPLFLLLAKKHARRVIVPVAVLAAISFVADAWLVNRSPAVAFYWAPFRAWELLLGACLALVRLPPARSWQAALGLVMIAVAVLGFGGTTPFPGLAALLPCAGAALLLHAGATPAGAVLRTRAAVFVGRISFSLYLWHWPVIVYYRYLLGEPGVAAVCALLLATFVLAALTFRFVEEPVRTRKALAAISWPAIAAALVGVAVGVVAMSGLPARFAPAVAAAEAASLDMQADAPHCDNRSVQQVTAGHLCTIGDASQQPRWLLWGDSHGFALSPAFDAALKRIGQSAMLATHDGCIPLLHVRRAGHYQECEAFSAAVSQLTASRDLKVILVGYWSGYEDVSDGLPGSSQEVVARGLQRSTFAVVVDALPGAPASVPRMLAQQLAYGRAAAPTFSLEEYLRRNAVYLSAVEGRPRLSLWRDLCAGGTCVIERNGRPLYMDGNHVALSAVDFAVPAVTKALEQATPAATAP
jgi:peptidoglycan/LPS O-acetylase OafA/YrhL